MPQFLNDSFLLKSKLAEDIFKQTNILPIIDYHSHISPKDIAEDKNFASVTEAWLGGDHYKWRLMRACGISEELITGKADDYEKFKAFAGIMPLIIGNPVYIWSHLELKRYFGFGGALCPENAKEVYGYVNKKLSSKDFSAKSIILKSNVETACTTDDPSDSLEYHKAIQQSGFKPQIIPTFRPDRALNLSLAGYGDYIKKLESVSAIKITDTDSLVFALKNRLDSFVSLNCKAADHGLSRYIYAECTQKEADAIFADAVSGKAVSCGGEEKFVCYMLKKLAEIYTEKNIVMQLHISCIRNPNSVMFNNLGADTGFDAVRPSESAVKLAALLDDLNKNGALPKTVIYSLDENDNAYIDSIINSFRSSSGAPIMHGASWWFNDTQSGIERHLRSLAERGAFGTFLGMLTDSRSLLSYTRHEFFRRILSNFLAEEAENGLYPYDTKALNGIAEKVAYLNTKNYFGF